MDKEIPRGVEFPMKILCGTCPDKVCSELVYFISSTGNKQVECPSCGQTHERGTILNIFEPDRAVALHKMIPNYMHKKKGTDFIRVNGLSNFYCKILSPLLTIYGMDKGGNPRLLTELGHSEYIDCGKVLGNRAFVIAPDHLSTVGYGKDQSGSLQYLSDLLDILKDHHKGEECLVPVHVDGDGHCLVHALSRALIGRELFWHSLRKNLQNHLKENIAKYMELFKDFYDKGDWDIIIDEADPYSSQGGLTLGLGNMHIFALSNILKRPILLLDSPQKMQSPGDYTGLFVPVLVDPSECSNKSPVCVAWSGSAHNHFVPLVAIEGKPLPSIPSEIIPRVWGVSEDVAIKYLEYNEDGSITVCQGKSLNNSYLRKLGSAMEKVFTEQNEISPMLVEELCRYAYRLNESPGLRPETITGIARAAVQGNRLFRCLVCKALQEVNIPSEDLKLGGELYEIVRKCYGRLNPSKQYSFPAKGIECQYDPNDDRLFVISCECRFCNDKKLRAVGKNGEVQYENGDATETPTTCPTQCNCGQKHYWNGKEYDNLPSIFPLTVEWAGKTLQVKITWFFGDSHPELNSNVEEEAQKIVNDHFPNEFATELLMGQLMYAIREKCEQLDLLQDHPTENFQNFLFEDTHNTAMGLNQYSNMMEVEQSHSHDTFPAKNTNFQSDDMTDKINTTFTERNSLSSVVSNKRKSNGESTPKLSSAVSGDNPTIRKGDNDQSIRIKISSKNSTAKTLQVDFNIDMGTLKDKIFNIFGIEPDKQILKYGFPPKMLHPAINGGPLGLKSGEKITVEVQKTQELTETSNPKPVQNPYSMIGVKLQELVTEQNHNGHSLMWKYAMGKPELFEAGGVFYEQFKQDIGLKHGNHCRLPLMQEWIFQYNETFDRLELCLEPDGHYPIDDEIFHCVEKFLNYPRTGAALGSSTTYPYTSSEIPNPNIDNSRFKNNTSSIIHGANESSKASSVAPGFHTVGSSPANLTKEEKESQREGLLKLVQQTKEKHASTGM